MLSSPFYITPTNDSFLPIDDRLVSIGVSKVHLFNLGSYFSTEFKDELPSFPPIVRRYPSMLTTSCVDL